MTELKQMEAISEALSTLHTARLATCNVTPVWLKLQNATKYLEAQIAEILAEA